MFSKTKKGKITTASRRTKKTTYDASPLDLVLGIDFELIDDPVNKWVQIKLLKGKYQGVVYKYNEIGVEEDPKKTGADNLKMKMDYDIINFNGHEKAIEKAEDFNNLIFNVVYAMLQMQAATTDQPTEEVDE